MFDLCYNLKYYLYDLLINKILHLHKKIEITASKQSSIYWFVSYLAK